MANQDDVEPDAANERYAGGEGEAAAAETGGGETYETTGLPGGRIPNPPPRDAWVSRVVDDPANPPDAVLLSGYVGDAAEEGRSRIYTDASLSSYVEVSDEDVLHHEAADTGALPEGGSLVWVRSDALVTPGSGGGAGGGAGGDFFTGPVLAQNRKPGTGTGAGTAQKPGPVQITLLTIAGCHTQRFGCTVFTCPTRNFLCRTVHPVVCSYVCQPAGGMGIPGGAVGMGGFEPVDTYGCPPTIGCMGAGFPLDPPRAAQGEGQPVGPTGYFHCGELIGNTGWQGCGQPHISLPGCIHTGICGGGGGAETLQAGVVSRHCQYYSYGPCPTHLIGCTGFQRDQVSLPGCVHTGTCGERERADTVYAAAPTGRYAPQCPTFGFTCTAFCHARGGGTDTVQAAVGPVHLPNSEWVDTGGTQGAGRQAPAAPTGQYAPQCPTFGFTCTYVHCPPQSLATVCTQLGCQTQPGGANTAATVCTHFGCPHISLPGCIHTASCPPGGGTDTLHAAAMAGPGNTTATVCTQVGCPPHTGHANCSMATICTQIGCHTAPQHCIPSLSGCGPDPVATARTQIGCHTFGFTCTAFCQMQGVGEAQAVGPNNTAATVCTQTGCPPHQAAHREAGPGNTTATLCTQIGCPTFGFTCTAFCQGAGGGLPGGMGGGGQGQATAATVCTHGGCIPRTRICPPTFQPGCGPDHEHGGSTAATLCTLAPFCPPTAHCPGQTVGTLCTQIGCRPHTGLGCPRTTTCPPTQTPGCGALRAAAPAAEAMAAPTTIYGPQCPTFGFTCTYVHCPPPVTAGLGCLPTGTCPPQSMPFNCAQTATCPTGICPPG